MPKGSTQKYRKSDRISTLPDELLSHILSLLPTKESVATSVLSTRWRSLWTLVPALDFTDDNNGFSKSIFIHVVGYLLTQRRTDSIKRLSLSSYNRRLTPNIVNLLVSIAVAKCLEELDLVFYYLEPTLPSRLFTCQTISVLKLRGNINLNLPSSVHLPLLKILHLYLVCFIDDEFIMSLLSGCPVLEELFYGEVIVNRSSSFKICVPSLKKLNVHSKHKGLQIDTPMLECLTLENTLVIGYLVGNMDNLVEADIDIFFDHEEEKEKENIPNLFSGISKTRLLCLSHCSTEVLTGARLEFPIFHNLVHLQLYLSSFDSYFLVELLLAKCPKLEVLDIEKVDVESQIEWTKPTAVVPSCLSSHLTMFRFKEYGDSKDELKLVGYILRNGKVLKTTTIQISNLLMSKKREKVVSKLCVLPRGSKDRRTNYEIIG